MTMMHLHVMSHHVTDPDPGGYITVVPVLVFVQYSSLQFVVSGGTGTGSTGSCAGKVPDDGRYCV